MGILASHSSTRRQPRALVVWGTWLISLLMFFSVAGDWDPYYLAMLAPAVAALVGVGVVTLWDDYWNPGWRGLAIAPDACTAEVQRDGTPIFSPIIRTGATGWRPQSFCLVFSRSRKLPSRTPEASVEDQWLSAGRDKRRGSVPSSSPRRSGLPLRSGMAPKPDRRRLVLK